MTLAPLVRPDIRGVEGKPCELTPKCVVPGCLSIVQARHHLWPRSYLRGQPYEWVRVGARVLANSAGFCTRHHNAVSSPVGGHQGKITYDEETGLFYWWESEQIEGGVTNWECQGPLRGQALVDAKPTPPRASVDSCPTCGRGRKKTTSRLPARKAATWTIAVPADSEIGGEILDTFVEDFGVLLGFDVESKRLLRYHVLCVILTWTSLHKAQLVADIEEAAAA